MFVLHMTVFSVFVRRLVVEFTLMNSNISRTTIFGVAGCWCFLSSFSCSFYSVRFCSDENISICMQILKCSCAISTVPKWEHFTWFVRMIVNNRIFRYAIRMKLDFSSFLLFFLQLFFVLFSCLAIIDNVLLIGIQATW